MPEVSRLRDEVCKPGRSALLRSSASRSDVWQHGTEPVCFIFKAEIPDLRYTSKINVETSQLSHAYPKIWV